LPHPKFQPQIPAKAADSPANRLFSIITEIKYLGNTSKNSAMCLIFQEDSPEFLARIVRFDFFQIFAATRRCCAWRRAGHKTPGPSASRGRAFGAAKPGATFAHKIDA